jgi:hypothetical protein
MDTSWSSPSRFQFGNNHAAGAGGPHGVSPALSAGLPAEFSPAFARPFDPRRFRALYPGRWREFLRAHFRDPVHVAYFFSVDPKTARDWWDGLSGAQGWAVAYAVQAVPGAAGFLRVAA